MSNTTDDRTVRTLTVIGERPHEVPTDWPIFNAPRPLYGNERWQGDWLHGRHYAAIDPADRYFRVNVSDSVEDDGWLVYWVSLKEARAKVRAAVYGGADHLTEGDDEALVDDLLTDDDLVRQTFTHRFSEGETTLGAVIAGAWVRQ